MVTFKSITYYDHASLVICVGQHIIMPLSHQRPPSPSLSAVLSAAHIVRLLVKHLIDGNIKAKPENPRLHKLGVGHYFWDQEVSASFIRIVCPINEQPFRPRDICLQCLVRLTKYSVNANRTKSKIQQCCHLIPESRPPNYRCESTLSTSRLRNSFLIKLLFSWTQLSPNCFLHVIYSGFYSVQYSNHSASLKYPV